MEGLLNSLKTRWGKCSPFHSETKGLLIQRTPIFTELLPCHLLQARGNLGMNLGTMATLCSGQSPAPYLPEEGTGRRVKGLMMLV